MSNNIVLALLGVFGFVSMVVAAPPMSMSISHSGTVPVPTATNGVPPAKTHAPLQPYAVGSNSTICSDFNMKGKCHTFTPLLSVDYTPEGNAGFCNSLNDTKTFGHKGSSVNITAALNNPNLLDNFVLYENDHCLTAHPDTQPAGLRHSVKYFLGAGMQDWTEDWSYKGIMYWQLSKEERVNSTASHGMPMPTDGVKASDVIKAKRAREAGTWKRWMSSFLA